LTKAACRDWSASGRRGAAADDARPREVSFLYSGGEVAEKKTGEPAAEGWSEGRRPRRTRAGKARAGHRDGKARHKPRSAYGRPQGFAVIIRSGSRMRESRTSGSGWGTKVTRFPTAIASRPLPCASAEVSCLITQRAFGLGGGNRYSCPGAAADAPGNSVADRAASAVARAGMTGIGSGATTTTAEVRLDQAAGFGAARPSIAQFWLPTGRLRSNSLAAGLDETKKSEPTGLEPGNIGLAEPKPNAMSPLIRTL
jgi:hypothetical protein